MRHLLTLAAAASLLAACHNRSEDEVGAAPDRGDTTAVATDSTKVAPTDSTMGQLPADTTAVQPSQDAGMSADTTAAPTAPAARAQDKGGTELPIPTPPVQVAPELPPMNDYGNLYRDFRWEIPARFNIGVAACDRKIGIAKEQRCFTGGTKRA